MGADNRNRDRQSGSRQFLPDVGMDVPDWAQNLLSQLKSRVEGLWQDPDIPGVPTGLTLTANNLGNKVQWNRTLKASKYQAFKNSTGDIKTATIIRELPGIDNTSFFDPEDAVATVPTRYYWVRALNATGVPGGFSSMKKITNFAVDTTGTAVGTNAISAGSFGTAVGANANSGSGTGNTVVGVGTTISGVGVNSCTAIGEGITITSAQSTVVGEGSGSDSPKTVAVGQGTFVNGANSVGVGQGITITHSNTCVIGNGGTSSADGQILIGTPNTIFSDVWFGRGTNQGGTPQFTRLRAASGTGTNIGGDHISIYGGAPTGNATGGSILFYTAAPGASGTALSIHSSRVTFDDKGNIFFNTSTVEIPTTATDGFMFISTCSGTPTGVPTYTGSGMAAMIFDRTNNRFYVYKSGWKGVTLT